MRGVIRYLYVYQDKIFRDSASGRSIILSRQHFSPRYIFITVDKDKIQLIEEGYNGELFKRYANKIGKIY